MSDNLPHPCLEGDSCSTLKSSIKEKIGGIKCQKRVIWTEDIKKKYFNSKEPPSSKMIDGIEKLAESHEPIMNFPSSMFKTLVENSFGCKIRPITNILKDYNVEPVAHKKRRKRQLISLFEKKKCRLLYNLVICEKNQQMFDEIVAKKSIMTMDKKRELSRSFKVCRNPKEFLRELENMNHQPSITEKTTDHKCMKCGKVFDRNCRLIKHAEKCVKSMLTCNICYQEFFSKRTLRQHKKNGCEFRDHRCKACGESFQGEKILTIHQTNCSMKVQCDFCDKFLFPKSLRMHIKRKHKHLTPSKLKHLSLKKEVQKKTSFVCQICAVSYYDKSTLNRHTKQQHSQLNNENIYAETERLEYNEKVRETIIETFNTLDLIFSVSAKKALSLPLLDEQFKRITRKALDINIVRILLASTPQLYTISKQKDDIQVYLVGSLNPSAKEDRNKCLLGALGSVEARKNAGGTYIDARLITATPKPKYKSAVELIAENVVTVSDESEESEVETQGDSTQYEKIVRKIRKKCNVKNKRNQEIEKRKPIWEAERLENMKRLLTKIFADATRKYLSVETVISKLRQSGYRSINVIKDVKKLAESGSFSLDKSYIKMT